MVGNSRRGQGPLRAVVPMMTTMMIMMIMMVMTVLRKKALKARLKHMT
jgi:hypothetical protein